MLCNQLGGFWKKDVISHQVPIEKSWNCNGNLLWCFVPYYWVQWKPVFQRASQNRLSLLLKSMRTWIDVWWLSLRAMGTCFCHKNLSMFCCFYYKQWEPAFSKKIGPQLEAFKGCPWPWWGMQWTEGVSRIPKMPLTHFFQKSAGPGFDILVLICWYK